MTGRVGAISRNESTFGIFCMVGSESSTIIGPGTGGTTPFVPCALLLPALALDMTDVRSAVEGALRGVLGIRKLALEARLLLFRAADTIRCLEFSASSRALVVSV